ncbi:hypothetical protein HDV04_006147 [Boothiomyces sp. JEL0838]|nr:hypothetical protein HDV04_006127 [Boothiomyces sp. JEL0838]KAJ3314608.1 hypothetical protein HDV04_006147 [Boothiomyces sp. JEL0838]
MVNITENWVEAKTVVGGKKAELYTRTWSPDSDADIKATLVFIHGLGEHITRYDEMFTYFTERGIKVGAFDQRGFGKTPQKYGVKGRSDGVETTLADILQISESLRKEGVPHFAMGHSMGGGLVLRFATVHPEGLAGVIASAPCVAPGATAVPNAVEKLALKYVPKALPNLVIPNKLDISTLSRDPVEVKKYADDPLVHSQAGVTLLSDILGTCDYLLTQGAQKLNTPLLITHGTVDKLTDPAASKKFHDLAVAQDKTYKPFDGFYHELHNEPDADRKVVFEEYVQWISIGEHIQRYDELFTHFANNGILTGGFDGRGFGQTVVRNGKKGVCDGIDIMLKDIELVAKQIRIDGVPHFAFGHSMAPLIRVLKVPNPIEKGLLTIVPSVYPSFAMPTNLDVNNLSRDENEVKKYVADPLVHPLASVALLNDILGMGTNLDTKWYKDFTLPLLVTHGSEDKITCPVGSKQFVENCASKDKTHRQFEGLRHELHNELAADRQIVFSVYVDWILSHAK